MPSPNNADCARKRIGSMRLWKGLTKLSKHGSGRVRRILYLAALRSIHLETSPFGVYYQRLVARGMQKGMAVVAVMRKMLIVAVHLIQTEESYQGVRPLDAFAHLELDVPHHCRE
jgi:hypothetical protein